jgi:hypothetical protein
MLPTCHGAPVAPHPSLLPATIVRGGVVPGNLTELVCRFPVSKLIQSSGKGADRSTSWMCGQIPIPRSARNGTSAATLRRLPAAEGSWGGTLPQALSGGPQSEPRAMAKPNWSRRFAAAPGQPARSHEEECQPLAIGVPDLQEAAGGWSSP